MTTLQASVLYAAEIVPGKKARPVRVLDTRHWTSYSSPRLDGFQWRLTEPDGWGRYRDTTGMACLYWSNTGDTDPDPQALLDVPWEPLPEAPDAAGQELTRRANAIGRPAAVEAHGSWLCLRPIERFTILGPWSEYDYEQLQQDRKAALDRRLDAWDEANRRLTALGLAPAECDPAGLSAPFTLEQITALLDRAEHGPALQEQAAVDSATDQS